MGFETPEEGYLAKIIVPSGTKNVPIGKLVCIIVSDEGSIAAFKDFKDDSSSTVTPAASAPSPPPATPKPSSPPPPVASTPVSAPIQQGDRVFATPLARKLASEKGLSLQVYNFKIQINNLSVQKLKAIRHQNISKYKNQIFL